MQSALKGRFEEAAGGAGSRPATAPPAPAAAAPAGATVAGFPASPGLGTEAITEKMLTSSPPSALGRVYAWLQRRGLLSFEGHLAQKKVGRSERLCPCTATTSPQWRQ